jgi:hypothetical protein
MLGLLLISILTFYVVGILISMRLQWGWWGIYDYDRRARRGSSYEPPGNVKWFVLLSSVGWPITVPVAFFVYIFHDTRSGTSPVVDRFSAIMDKYIWKR